MNDNSNFVELARLPIVQMQDVLLARFLGRSLATQLGFGPETLTRFATAISEITRNVVQHAGAAGEIQIGRLAQGDKLVVRMIVKDHGKGIERPQRFLQEGGVIGAGLLGTQRLVDQFQIESAPGSGTTVIMDFWKPETNSSSDTKTEGATPARPGT